MYTVDVAVARAVDEVDDLGRHAVGARGEARARGVDAGVHDRDDDARAVDALAQQFRGLRDILLDESAPRRRPRVEPSARALRRRG